MAELAGPRRREGLAENLERCGISDGVEWPGQGEDGLGVARLSEALTKVGIRRLLDMNLHKSLGQHRRLYFFLFDFELFGSRRSVGQLGPGLFGAKATLAHMRERCYFPFRLRLRGAGEVELQVGRTGHG